MLDDRALWDEIAPLVVFRSQVGSRLFGTQDAKSDDDLRGIWIGLPFERRPPTLHDPSGKDNSVIEIRPFVGRLLAGDNNALEILFGNPRLTTAAFQPLLDIRGEFVSREWLDSCRMFYSRARGLLGKPKYQSYLAHALRVMSVAVYTVDHAEYDPRVDRVGWTPEDVSAYRRLKRGVESDDDFIGNAENRAGALYERLVTLDLPPVDHDLVQHVLGEILAAAWG